MGIYYLSGINYIINPSRGKRERKEKRVKERLHLYIGTELEIYIFGVKAWKIQE
jgi:hypothetical protein